MRIAINLRDVQEEEEDLDHASQIKVESTARAASTAVNLDMGCLGPGSVSL